ncbi:WecB/TagA/CpsF family glycosyltransferase [Paracraurococcus lichenis]|uniref:WecB/TagA/CpsF family glycosyltransferase n=1 Tax=Paracraurococcus lichenis TaxID=3064888 RepID=A0ABT9E8Q6_9PROT|nr:WecB/TagA/CpsF family glycosyltransferase [Paracraurococcus sp. LOR1-02]MDO9712569.1 WecB/TagA/CpsF family glycosyltransferase [Paracraurococcus sp. LOR1-02]
MAVPASQPAVVDVLGVRISTLNLAETVRHIAAWKQEGRREYVCCVCVHGIVTAQRDKQIRAALNGAGIATKDGMPLSWWCRAVGFRGSKRVSGSDLMEALCAFGASRGYRHYFYGGTPAVVEALVDRLQHRFPDLVVAGYRSPPFRPLSAAEDAAEVAAINAAQADFVWVGLGMPKQERWIAGHVGRIDATALLGVGAAFDFLAGAKPRAPGWMQQVGLEWLFRLASEPRRLARRYIVDNGAFVAMVLRHLLSQRPGPTAP